MQLEGISSGSSPVEVEKKDNQTLDKDDFLKLLVTQLQCQDPLNPMQDTEFIAQTAQFSSLEQMQNLNTTLEDGLNNLLVAQYELLYNFSSWQSTLSGLSLMGKEILGEDADGESITGIVQKVKFTDDGPVAVVNGKEVKISDIKEIGDPTNPTNEDGSEEDSIEGEENE